MKHLWKTRIKNSIYFIVTNTRNEDIAQDIAFKVAERQKLLDKNIEIQTEFLMYDGPVYVEDGEGAK
jgi:hypothetical protein